MGDAGRKGTFRNICGEAVVILMAAMMIGGFLLWMAAGHFHGMHGGSHRAMDSRPAAAVAPVQAVSQEGGATEEERPPRWSMEETMEKGREVR